MSHYDPYCETRGTCPYCEKRCRVFKAKGTFERLCGRHKRPMRERIGQADPCCPGAGLVCLEDRGRDSADAR